MMGLALPRWSDLETGHGKPWQTSSNIAVLVFYGLKAAVINKFCLHGWFGAKVQQQLVA